MSEETLFHEALARPAAERAAFLDPALRLWPRLRRAVECPPAAQGCPGTSNPVARFGPDHLCR